MKDLDYYWFYKTLYHILGKQFSLEYYHARWRFKMTQKNCAICNQYLTHRKRTIDHIIPKSVCWELGLYNLINDPINFRVTCAQCNEKRGAKVDEFPKLATKLYEIRSNKNKA